MQILRHPEDTALRAIVAELRAGSQRFAALWTDPPATTLTSLRGAGIPAR